MSGIAGFYQTEYDYTQDSKWRLILNKMNKSLSHRGPDGNGIRLEPHAGFSQNRLSSICNSGENGPVSLPKGEQNAMIVFNGELFNSTECKLLLKPYVHYEQACSDSETVLGGYLSLGNDFFRQLNGVFAFAIYDRDLDLLLLCRDRIGAKPLFYQQYGSTFVFGSEPKALFAYGISPELDNESFGEIFGVGPARTLGKAVFKNMKEVLPGHFLTIKGSHVEDHLYWQLQGKEHNDSYEETIEKVSGLVYDSIRRQTTAGTPISCFLSGGLDSSLVSAICAKELAKSGQQLDTYSFDFRGNIENFKANSFQSSLDRPFVDIMVSHIGSNHTYLFCDTDIQVNYLEKAVDAADLPNMGDIEASLVYFIENASYQSRVALTGEGADELFGGYPWFHRESALSESCFPWANDMSFRLALLTEDFLKKINPADYARSAYEKTITATPKYDGDSPMDARRRELSYLTFQWFMVTLLNRMDRTSMFSGFQARVPFGDFRLAEYLYNVPWNMKCFNGINKNLLIEAGKDLLPDEVLYRKKSPYPKTYDPAYEKMLGDRLKSVLSEGSSPLLGIVDKKKVEQFLSHPSDYGKPWYGQLMAGPQMLAYLLQINYWMKKYQL